MVRKNKTYNCYKKYILICAHAKYPNIRKRKYSLEYYLDNFTLMLSDVVSWESLKYRNDINKDNKYHWKSIYNEYNKWSKDNIFEDAYFKFIKENYFKMSRVRKNKKINMFIDVTKISNVSGRENIGINAEYKKKNVTALSAICDDNKIPLGITPMDTNLSKTKTGKHTIKHDVKGVQKTLDTIPFKLKEYVSVKLIGDKGYVTNKEFKVFGKKIKMIYPKRKNQKKKNTKKEKNILSKRHKIENFFASLKKYNRIVLRRDHKINNYMSFTYMGVMDHLFSNLLKMKEK